MKSEHRDVIRHYIRAKDENRPELMERAFTGSATLSMELQTQNIDFPSLTDGREAITEVLVRDFSRNYENVHTFCLEDSVKVEGDRLSCDWLVVMSTKNGGDIRVGCGSYRWQFNAL